MGVGVSAAQVGLGAVTALTANSPQLIWKKNPFSVRMLARLLEQTVDNPAGYPQKTIRIPGLSTGNRPRSHVCT
jgi:hypothetical protein